MWSINMCVICFPRSMNNSQINDQVEKTANFVIYVSHTEGLIWYKYNLAAI